MNSNISVAQLQLPQFQHHGAVLGVTGSCHRFIANEQNHVLIDCGLFQGEGEKADAFAQHQIEFSLSAVSGKRGEQLELRLLLEISVAPGSFCFNSDCKTGSILSWVIYVSDK